jgi:hypothetical protein
MARKIDAVVHGFAEIRLDQTTEEQLTKTVPYLAQKDWTDRSGVLHHCVACISPTNLISGYRG